MARGTWSVPESKLYINFLELKAVLLALKRFELLVQGNSVLIVTDNTTVVAYINKESGMRSGSLCALLWRLPPWCNLRQIVLKARQIPGYPTNYPISLPQINQYKIVNNMWATKHYLKYSYRKVTNANSVILKQKLKVIFFLSEKKLKNYGKMLKTGFLCEQGLLSRLQKQ